ncbi:hypothetical protein EVAR_28561_1 [Eumeta japonica]|uniref:Uncharacterized protein n=1 Tax=Eumeta variegata TaxID=151549 RepID=A0A4C1UXE9_EUMVA|nr:hypothetical protein EVAR_28561_1 [Eumeta japonica]
MESIHLYTRAVQSIRAMPEESALRARRRLPKRTFNGVPASSFNESSREAPPDVCPSRRGKIVFKRIRLPDYSLHKTGHGSFFFALRRKLAFAPGFDRIKTAIGNMIGIESKNESRIENWTRIRIERGTTLKLGIGLGSKTGSVGTGSK